MQKILTFKKNVAKVYKDASFLFNPHTEFYFILLLALEVDSSVTTQ